jgi:hypothetical protein
LLAEGIDGSDVPEPECGNGAEDDCCGDRHERGESEYDGIESDFLQARDGVFAEETQHTDRAIRQNESQNAAEAGKDQALNKHLTQESPLTSSQR